MTRFRLVMVLGMWVVLCGCSDDTAPPPAGLEICDNGVDDNGDGLTDCKDPQCYQRLQSCRKDAAPPVVDLALLPDKPVTPADAAPPALALQSVINRMLLPKTAGDIGMVFTGDGKVDNKLGQILAGLKSIHGGLDVQKDLDEQFKDGEILVLHEIFSDSLTDAKSAHVVAHFGKDMDGNASDNFSGSELFGIAPVTPGEIRLKGSISSGKMSFGPGTLLAPIAIGKVYVVITLRKAWVKGTVTAKGITDGLMAGAIPIVDVKNRMLPGLSTQMTHRLNASRTTPAGLKLLKYFDKDSDGTITVKELAADPLIKGLLLDQPDVDTDGDKTMDAVSVGIGFTSVPCKIQKN